MNDADDIRKVERKALGYALIIKYVGFAIMGFSLIFVLLGSLFSFRLPYTTEGILFGIFLISIGYVAEIIFSQESEM